MENVQKTNFELWRHSLTIDFVTEHIVAYSYHNCRQFCPLFLMCNKQKDYADCIKDLKKWFMQNIGEPYVGKEGA